MDNYTFTSKACKGLWVYFGVDFILANKTSMPDKQKKEAHLCHVFLNYLGIAWPGNH